MIDWEPKLIQCAEDLLCLESRRLLCQRHQHGTCRTKLSTKPLIKSLLALELQQIYFQSWIKCTSRARSIAFLKGKLRSRRRWSHLDAWQKFSRMNIAKKFVSQLRRTKSTTQAFLRWFQVACDNKSVFYRAEYPPYSWSSVLPWIGELINLGLVLQVSSEVGI
jgi:hypothetical protein